MRTFNYFLTCSLCVGFGIHSSFAQLNLPSSLDGIGIPFQSIPSQLIGAPGLVATSVSKNIINYLNPASYGSLSSVNIDIGIRVDNVNYNHVIRSFENSFSTISIANTHLSIPIKKTKLSFVIGYLPYTQIGLKLYYTAKVPTSSTLDSVNQVLSGQGGCYLLHTGLGYQLNKYVSVGANIGYLWGTKEIIVQNQPTGINTSTYSTSYDSRRLFFSGMRTTLGAIGTLPLSDKLLLRLGITASLPVEATSSLRVLRGTINRTQVTTGLIDTVQNNTLSTIRNVSIPSTFRAGISIATASESIVVGLTYSSTQWSQFAIDKQIENGLFAVNDDWKIALGVQLRPNSTSDKNSTMEEDGSLAISKKNASPTYSIGGAYSKTHLNEVNGNSVNKYSFSIGVKFPIKRYSYSHQVGALSLALIYEVQGNIDQNTFPHNTLTLQFGISLGDVWFLKRKYF